MVGQLPGAMAFVSDLDLNNLPKLEQVTKVTEIGGEWRKVAESGGNSFESGGKWRKQF